MTSEGPADRSSTPGRDAQIRSRFNRRSFILWIVAGLAGTIALIALGALGLRIFQPDSTKRADDLRAIAYFFPVLLAVPGAYFLVLRLKKSEEQHDLAERQHEATTKHQDAQHDETGRQLDNVAKQIDLTLQQIRLEQDKEDRRRAEAERATLRARYTEAVTLLGSESPVVRQAGVYALANLADDEASLRQQCIDVLCGYLRLPYETEHEPLLLSHELQTIESASRPGVDDWSGSGNRRMIPGRLGPRPTSGSISRSSLAAGPKLTRTYRHQPGERGVRLTIVRALRDRYRKQDDGKAGPWTGYDLDFTGTVFEDADFSGADFGSAHVSFDDARFVGNRIDFSGVGFGASVSFSGAKFSGTTTAFTGALFYGVTDFGSTKFNGRSASFRDAKFAVGLVKFESAVFDCGVRVDFFGAAFTGSYIIFSATEFVNTQLSFHDSDIKSGRIVFDHVNVSDHSMIHLWRANYAREDIVTRDGKPFRGWPIPQDDDD